MRNWRDGSVPLVDDVANLCCRDVVPDVISGHLDTCVAEELLRELQEIGVAVGSHVIPHVLGCSKSDVAKAERLVEPRDMKIPVSSSHR